jgi:hypothetical protein
MQLLNDVITFFGDTEIQNRLGNEDCHKLVESASKVQLAMHKTIATKCLGYVTTLSDIRQHLVGLDVSEQVIDSINETIGYLRAEAMQYANLQK